MRQTEQIQMTESDYVEIYYALEYKLTSPIMQGDDSEQIAWREQLQSIMDRISDHQAV